MTGTPVARLVRPACVVPAATTVRDAVAAMGAQDATAVVVTGLRPGAGVGICTDRDLRVRVLAAGLDPGVPVGRVATPDAVTLDPGAGVAEALLAMTEGRFRHLPVVDPAGTVVGMLEDRDLLSHSATHPLHLSRAAARAADDEALVAVARRLPDAWASATASGLDALHTSAAVSAVADGVVARAVALAVAGLPAERTGGWLVLGSLGRREGMPGSDVDAVLVVPEPLPGNASVVPDGAGPAAVGDPPVTDALGADDPLEAAARRVDTVLRASSVAVDDHGLTPVDPRSRRTLAQWLEAVAHWSTGTDADALMWAGALLDARPVHGRAAAEPLTAAAHAAARGHALGRRLGWAATAALPPALRGPLSRRRAVDLKHDGAGPVAHVARWAAATAGSTATGTLDRLRDARAAGVLDDEDAAVLREAFVRLHGVRLERRLAVLSAGGAPSDATDVLPLAELDRLSRRELVDVLRAVRRVESDLRARWAAEPGT